MNERLQYEQLIGEKLQGLPLPDIEDLIWNRIREQLDIDLPADDKDGDNSPQSPFGPGNIGWGLSIVIIALVTTFFLIKNKPKTKDNTIRPPATTEQIASPSVQNNSPPLPNSNTIKKPNTSADVITDNTAQEAGNDPVLQQDLGAIDKIANDSSEKNLPLPLVAAPPKSDTALQIKKGKGMKDLKDGDYRIVPKNNN